MPDDRRKPDRPPRQASPPGSMPQGTDPLGEEEDEDFARLLEESSASRSFERGELVEGRIVALGQDVAFIDVGGKGEATIDLGELADPDGDLDVQVGDIVQGIVVSTAGGLKLSHQLARGAATRERLNEAFQAGLPVEGRVEKAIKGGYDVRIGGLRAFCPISQIDSSFTADPSVHEGCVYPFRIMEYREGGKNLVVSRRALLEAQERERAEEVRRSIVPGAVLPGRVAAVHSYGAFVDLGGRIQGLLHVSEMGWSRVADAGQVVRPGDEVTVKVLQVDEAKGKISLGLKQLQPDPWATATDTYEVGQVLQGRVTRVVEFGAFIELQPGIEALAHASTFPPTAAQEGFRASVSSGATVAVKVLSFDPERKRIGVAVVDEAQVRTAGSPEGGIVPGARVRGQVQRHEKFGLIVFLAPGRSGLVPLAESGAEKEGDLARTFPVGSDIDVIVTEVDPAGSRIRLSRKAVLEAEGRREARDYAQRQDQRQSEGFGSLADKLRQAIRPRED